MTLHRLRTPRSAFAEGRHFPELRAGNLGVRIARSPAEVDAAQALRYRVFYEEMGANPTGDALTTRRDVDAYDTVADHLLVIDHDLGAGTAGVVGTYRMIQAEGAARIGGFYSAHEYDLSVINAFPGRVLELGRSCVDAVYRGRAVMQLLWRGLAAYVSEQQIDLMFGCASLGGTDPDALATELSFLHAHHLAPPALRMRALPDRFVEMRRLKPGAVDAQKPVSLPPLIKGYLRVGGFVGDGAVIDEQFNTIDVAIIVRTDQVTEKYLKHYERGGAELTGPSRKDEPRSPRL